MKTVSAAIEIDAPPKITVARPGTELRWATGLPGLVGGEHSFTLNEALKQRAEARAAGPRS